MGKNDFARTLTGSDSGYGDDVSERNSSSNLHPLCEFTLFVRAGALLLASGIMFHVLTR